MDEVERAFRNQKRKHHPTGGVSFGYRIKSATSLRIFA